MTPTKQPSVPSHWVPYVSDSGWFSLSHPPTWQVERRKRTRHLIELGGLVVKAGIVDLTGDDRAMIYGALLWMADKLQSDQGEHARRLWAARGKQALEDH